MRYQPQPSISGKGPGCSAGAPIHSTRKEDRGHLPADSALYGQRTLPAGQGSLDLIALVIFLAGFFILRKWKLSPIKVMAGAAFAGAALYTLAG